jgi:hypothetical protein
VRELRARVERSRAPDAAPPPHNASPDPGASAGTVQLGTLYGRVWREAAEETGASIEELAPEVFELRRGDRAIRVWRDVVDVDDPVTLALARDLALARRLLLRADVPVPDHLEFSARDPKPALEFLSAGGPCTIGPSLRRDGERGSTSGIETAAQLRRASREAATQTERLLIEREAPGELYRLLLLDGELIDALRISRHADGAGAGRDAACGPLAPELVAQAGAAQRTVGVRLAGVEVITSDPSRSPAETGAVVFDVRGNPPLHEHHPAPPHPGSSPVLVSLVGRLLPASARGDDDVPLASSGAATSNGAGWRALLPQSPHTE